MLLSDKWYEGNGTGPHYLGNTVSAVGRILKHADHAAVAGLLYGM